MRKTEGSPLPFGAAAKERKVNFSVQVPMGKTCELLLYREGNTKPEVCFDMPEEEGIGEVRFLSVEEIDPEKYEYNFLIDGKVVQIHTQKKLQEGKYLENGRTMINMAYGRKYKFQIMIGAKIARFGIHGMK